MSDTEKWLRAERPYSAAYSLYMAGRITSDQAIAMVARDRDFIAESELRGYPPAIAARAVVIEKWRAELVARTQQQQRGA
jgi:hypothetical protein